MEMRFEGKVLLVACAAAMAVLPLLAPWSSPKAVLAGQHTLGEAQPRVQVRLASRLWHQAAAAAPAVRPTPLPPPEVTLPAEARAVPR